MKDICVLFFFSSFPYLKVEDFIVLRVVGFPLDLGLLGFRSVADERHRKGEEKMREVAPSQLEGCEHDVNAHFQFSLTVCSDTKHEAVVVLVLGQTYLDGPCKDTAA